MLAAGDLVIPTRGQDLKAGECAAIAATLRALWDEAAGERLGARTAITRLTDVRRDHERLLDAAHSVSYY